MKLAIEISAVDASNLRLITEWVQFAEKLCIDMAFAAEAWWSDAVTPLAYLAAKTSRIKPERVNLIWTVISKITSISHAPLQSALGS